MGMKAWQEYGFYIMVGLFIALYVIALISGVPNKIDLMEYEYAESFVGEIMRALFLLPMALIVPLGFVSAVYAHLTPEKNEFSEKASIYIFLFSYAIITLLSSVLFFIISQKLFFGEYIVTGWIYLSSGVLLFLSIFIKMRNCRVPDAVIEVRER